MTKESRPLTIDLTPCVVAKEERGIQNAAAHMAKTMGEKPAVPAVKEVQDESLLSAAQKLELIDAQLRELAAKTGMPLDKARILDIRARVVDVQGRHKIKTPAPAEDPEQTEDLAIKFLEARGCIVRRNNRIIHPRK